MYIASYCEKKGFVMTELQVGIAVEGDTVTVVEAKVPADSAKPIVIVSDTTWTLQNGDRAAAYDVLYRRCVNYLRENNIARIFVKASATTRNAASLALLHSAELRGVVVAAAASVAEVKTLAKNHITKHYGDRTADEYLKDDTFWAAHTTGGKLRKTSRFAAMILIASRN
jgi:ribonuclease BN (tRNA processing enzyme)